MAKKKEIKSKKKASKEVEVKAVKAAPKAAATPPTRQRNQIFLSTKVEKHLDKKCKALGLVYGANTTMPGKTKRTVLIAEVVENLVMADIKLSKEGKEGSLTKLIAKIYKDEEG